MTEPGARGWGCHGLRWRYAVVGQSACRGLLWLGLLGGTVLVWEPSHCVVVLWLQLLRLQLLSRHLLHRMDCMGRRWVLHLLMCLQVLHSQWALRHLEVVWLLTCHSMSYIHQLGQSNAESSLTYQAVE